MLADVKKNGTFKGIAYNHRGPAHLSIGQEASAAGQAYLLGVDDHIFGSHRSHGEILAKGLSAIEKLDDDALMKIMQGYLGGAILRVIEKPVTGHSEILTPLHPTVKTLAVDFLLYGALAEIFGRDTGFNRGMG